MSNGGDQNEQGRINDHGGFRKFIPRKRAREIEPTNGSEQQPNPKKQHKDGGEEEEQQGSPSSVVTTGSDTNDPPLRTNSAASINKPLISDMGKEVALNLRDKFDAEDRAYVTNMKPELRYAIDYLESNAKFNSQLKVGLKMFMSAFKFMESVAFLAKEMTYEDKPSPNHD